ncbi:F-box/LRR-repeat protein At3g59250 [Arabidopsis lyrata subsp. lyrata]|uniref:F-box/LRR-repeat protein At3g59250 n=1 Tax=Arabidopsis lyrata subsp. lyrata TaxID=81972 RepID=UPI000A29D58A|nr:F-box/LRR-repeat protein At3g59250 [Arabidopsis lyrata subsp. lyrata]|eukprot:XP_020879609.1 F-box/LRR-repeat protein At3g59250 [Arabidopsis lyrata subsp. lyrata]
MTSKKMDIGPKDIISNLPEALICHILSFLPIEDSALTSVLSKRWRYLFAFTPYLVFDDSMFLRPCGHGVVPDYVTSWVLNVLERGVLDLDLHVTVYGVRLPSKVFVSKSLVSLRIESGNVRGIDVDDVFLPKLKYLYINTIMLGKADDCFEKLTAGCHVLEELVLNNVYSNIWNRSVSSKTLKRLTLWCIDYDKNPDSVSFDTPNLVYLKYSDYVARKYPKVNFRSLVDATIDLAMTSDQDAHASYEALVGNAKDFLMGICNVQILYLSANTLGVLTFCCESIPVFNNLIHLTIETRNVGWESLPPLLKNCPNLETLVFQGLRHRYTIKCGDVDGCLCKYSGEISSCLSLSPVKVLKILRFDEYGIENQIELIKLFLETMPCLEQLTIYYDTPIDDALIQVSSHLKNFAREASPNCEIQVIHDDVLS